MVAVWSRVRLLSHWNNWGSERKRRAGLWDLTKCDKLEEPLLAPSIFHEIT